MQFGPWYPLADARDHTPEGENVLQLRVRIGLLDYPRGKSAMVSYEHAARAHARAIALADAHRDRDLLCRHLIEIDAARDLAAFHAKLQEEFLRRFGAPPTLPPPTTP